MMLHLCFVQTKDLCSLQLVLYNHLSVLQFSEKPCNMMSLYNYIIAKPDTRIVRKKEDINDTTLN